MPAEPLLTDGQYVGLITAIGVGLGGIAAAVRWGLGRGAKAFDDMALAFKALADRHQSTQETLVKLGMQVHEGRSDIAEIKQALFISLAEAKAAAEARAAARAGQPLTPKRRSTNPTIPVVPPRRTGSDDT